MLWGLRKLGKIDSLRRLVYFLYRLRYLGKTVTVGSGPIKGMQWKFEEGQQFWLPLGRYEPETANWLAENIKRGDLFLDIGANWGYFTLAGSRMVGENGKVVSVEPIPRNQDFIAKHIEINGLKNVELWKVAISDTDGTAHFSLEEQNANSHLSSIDITHARSKTTDEFEVETITLDSLVQRLGRTPDVIKLDVEGAEGLVVKGAESLIAQKATKWIISTHSEKLKREILEKFTDSGYSVAELPGFEHEILCCPKTAP